MAIYLDSANLEEIKDIKAYPFVEGVTTNPALIAKALGKERITAEEFEEHIKKIKELVKGEIFVQTNFSESVKIIEEGKRISKILGNQAVIKIPVSLEGFKAMQKLSSQGIKTAATAVFTAVQGYLAVLSGAEYVIPYYSRLQRGGQDGLDIVEDLMDIFESNDFDAKLLLASVKTPFDVLEIVRAGADGVTLPKCTIDELIFHHQTKEAVEQFDKALKVDEKTKK